MARNTHEDWSTRPPSRLWRFIAISGWFTAILTMILWGYCNAL